MVSEKQLEELGVVNWSVLAQDFIGADLLLGNGFSFNIAGHLNYKSLFEEFLSKLSLAECKIFNRLGTTHFELIQEKLINAREVNKLFRIEMKNKIESAIELLKDGLIESIENTHPRSSQIDRDQLQRLSTQFNHFSDIFTLNYDLFLYHIIMLMKEESDKEGKDAPYSDYFWGDCEYDELFKRFEGYDDYLNRKHVYYLHGALFLFKMSPDTLKLKRADNKELIEMIRDVINKGTMPLFVSEGKYKEKLKVIERSDYLSFCHRSLEELQNKLVIFGSSLSDQDAHIVNAINYRRNEREIAIAIHVGTKSKSELEKEMKCLEEKFRFHNIYFFDSETIFKF